MITTSLISNSPLGDKQEVTNSMIDREWRERERESKVREICMTCFITASFMNSLKFSNTCFFKILSAWEINKLQTNIPYYNRNFYAKYHLTFQMWQTI